MLLQSEDMLLCVCLLTLRALDSEQPGSLVHQSKPSFTTVYEQVLVVDSTQWPGALSRDNCEVIILVNAASVLLQARRLSGSRFAVMLEKEVKRQNRILMFGLFAAIVLVALLLGYAAMIIEMILA